jgi:transposase, IS30 family
MALHQMVTQTVGMPVYFCRQGRPWQRGSNENTNGLLRHYSPKGTDLNLHSAEELQRISEELNQRPRKTLGWQTPLDLFVKLQAGTS